jgi:hypothetical protein
VGAATAAATAAAMAVVEMVGAVRVAAG